jgi:outer membrane protein assembly factor BamD
MYLRVPVIALAATLALTTACTNKKVSNPLAKVDSKQPDKVLFDRALDAMKHNHYDVARITLQTLIATYPDSEFIARAKLSLADSWYAEGGSAGMAQAEQEYKDFETFFPNMPEAAEAQLKIADIHFGEMEKPDRDYTHAVRAEQEYRQVILQYPDNPKVVAEAKRKLMQVQEVIAEREYRVGRFYFLRDSNPAAIARLQSLVDRYPLYSKADEALYLIGQSYENEVSLARRPEILEKEKKFTEAQRKNSELMRERYSTDALAKAEAAYSKIVTRYPAMARYDDAKTRLLALKQPVPRPTRAMLAQNKAEEAARREQTMLASVMSTLSHHPDVTAATNVGEPSLEDKDLVSAKDLVQAANRAISGETPGRSVSVTAVKDADTKDSVKAPRSDDPAADDPAAAVEKTPVPADPNDATPAGVAAAQQTDAADPNELKPIAPTDALPPQAPAQVNELAQGAAPAAADTAQASNQDLATDEAIASSKHKKKKGLLEKIVPGK